MCAYRTLQKLNLNITLKYEILKLSKIPSLWYVNRTQQHCSTVPYDGTAVTIEHSSTFTIWALKVLLATYKMY